MALKFADIISQNKILENKMSQPVFKIKVLSNIVVNPLSPILEHALRQKNIFAKCSIGEYNNIVQESINCKDSDAVIIFWELANLVEGAHYILNDKPEKDFFDLIEKIKSEILFVFNEINKNKIVLFNKFSSLLFNYRLLDENQFDYARKLLNAFIEEKKPDNVKIIDIDKVFTFSSIEDSVDYRNYYSYKMLYTIDFLKEYVEYVKPIFLSLKGYSKKVLVADCDNTLWHGVLGEDGVSGIKMGISSSGGAPYNEVQYLLKSLRNKGVVIGLNSKNNPGDVEDIILNHPDMVLRDDDIIIKKINWKDKISNLRAIAAELNIGLDSIVFIDDSDFEINLIKEYLPEVLTIQVPKDYFAYPNELRRYFDLFYQVNETREDRERALMYKQDQVRALDASTFSNIDDYLKSLELSLGLDIDNNDDSKRISQLTQKTNQFNFTTRRYSEPEILQFIKESGSRVFTIKVSDKYGNLGLTGVVILKIEEKTAFIDTFLLSCRILGRNIELKFLDEIIHFCKIYGCKYIKSEYIKTVKNIQIENFYEKSGFTLLKSTYNLKEYGLAIDDYVNYNIDYIKVEYNGSEG